MKELHKIQGTSKKVSNDTMIVKKIQTQQQYKNNNAELIVLNLGTHEINVICNKYI